jgi:hypothetical protein
MSADAGFWARLVLAVLATWRLTHLLVREDGPADLIVRARTALGAGVLGRMFDCFHCTSLWVAIPFALWITIRPLDAAVLWLALSGAACLCERLGQPEVVLQPLPEPAEGDDDGMLRTKP